jgi:hypothetical protein
MEANKAVSNKSPIIINIIKHFWVTIKYTHLENLIINSHSWEFHSRPFFQVIRIVNISSRLPWYAFMNRVGIPGGSKYASI